MPSRRRQTAGSLLPVVVLGAKLGWPLLALLVVYAIGGDDTPSPELRARARRQAEEQLMGRLATAGPEIERRLAQWLTVRDGLLFLREPPTQSSPTQCTCCRPLRRGERLAERSD